MSSFVSAQKLKKANKEIVQYLQQQVGYLSSDELKGRRAGDPGEIMAAEFIALHPKETTLLIFSILPSTMEKKYQKTPN